MNVADVIAAGADGAPAIGAPGQPSLDYAGLRALVAESCAGLRGFGISPEARVAIVLANGPEMATAFVAVACAAVTAPLNPAYTFDEFVFYLQDLRASALVVLQGCVTAAREAAAACGVAVIELERRPEAAGLFRLHFPTPRVGAGDLAYAPPQDNDVALILHTSGTTARPKIVPLTHGNIAASARHIGATLALGPDDICLNIMPLFHIHGLIAAVLASLAAGACVVCTPGLSAFKFFGWLRDSRASWFTAVPTMHQTLLELAPRHADIIAGSRLRFIRSSSASLPPAVMAALESAFGVPVIEAYGMTEASHQMASNPLPPAARFAGSVGVAAGPEIAIMDEAGALLPAGETGEVVIRGPNVTAGYENNPVANAASFTNGWFRTGDQGVMDADGYLRLTGRLKEIINRAGEKISPLEVDNRLMEHPDVAQAVTFALPSALYGEEVGAAVVLRADAVLSEADLCAFVGARLAAFKVPRRVVFVAEIPKGATGKMQRIGLAGKLGV